MSSLELTNVIEIVKNVKTSPEFDIDIDLINHKIDVKYHLNEQFSITHH